MAVSDKFPGEAEDASIRAHLRTTALIIIHFILVIGGRRDSPGSRKGAWE
jgi:hypothetical protein